MKNEETNTNEIEEQAFTRPVRASRRRRLQKKKNSHSEETSTWRRTHEEDENGRPKQSDRRPMKTTEDATAIEIAIETEREVAVEIENDRIDAMKSVQSSDGTSSGGREDEIVEKSKYERKRGDNKVLEAILLADKSLLDV